MSKFWKSISDFFKSDDEHVITDEEWEKLQAEQAQKTEETGDEPEELEDGGWICPECHTSNPSGVEFCTECGYHPGSFTDILPTMTNAQLELVLGGSCRYPAEELEMLEKELERRHVHFQAHQDDESPDVNQAERGRLEQEYAEQPAESLYEIVENLDYTPEARLAARAVLRGRGLPEMRESAGPALSQWKCPRCGRQNPETEYFCTSCGEYRY